MIFPRAVIVVVGFPKCGTTALITKLGADRRTYVLRPGTGSVEVSWPLIKTMEFPEKNGIIRVHNSSSYIFSKTAVKCLAESNPDSIIDLCVRDSKRALISWHHMHRLIAKSGSSPEHFAYKERAFYAKCSLSGYYERFAQSRLQYDVYFDRLFSIVPKDRIVVVSQERIARGISSVAMFLKELVLGARDPQLLDVPQDADHHIGYADNHAQAIGPQILKELKPVKKNLLKEVRASGVRSCL